MLTADSSELKLKSLFQEYYGSWNAMDVDLISEREIGFIPFFGTMIRHRAVGSLRDLGFFVRRNIPRHVYYSSAYYRKPDEKVMKEKIWKGAELIFDLDADHLVGADKMAYHEILAEVKKHTGRLVFKFLMDDLGFGEKDLKIFFSGGRGYHVHVVEDTVYPMSSDARREIANYIRGEGFSTFDVKRSMQDTPERLGGWKRIIDESICSFYSDLLENQEKEETLHRILGNSRTLASYMTGLRKSANTEEGMRRIDLLRTPGRQKYRLMDGNDDKVLAYLIKKAKEENLCEIDEPVTTDIHRLIRLPHSLHGKTGLVVKPISLEGFADFDPLKDAIAEKFREGSAKVEVLRRARIKFQGEEINLEPGETEVSKALAVFLSAGRLSKFI